MKSGFLRRWKILVPVVCLAAFIAAEKLAFLGTDSISAIACTKELIRARPEPAAVIQRFREPISTEARRHDLPPELLAAIIYSHQAGLTSFRAFTDCAGSAMGSDLSLGLGQIRISTAAGNDGILSAALSARRFRQYRTILLDPLQNIGHLAREVRLLLDRGNRFPGIAAGELVHNAHAMALVLSEYRMGRQGAGSNTARIGASGLWDLGHMERGDVYIFGRDAPEVQRIQEGVRRYLDHAYCEKGIFKPEVCAARRG